MDIGGWLGSLGLERYEAAFRENAVDTDILRDLTDQDLEKLGVLLGDRRRLLRAIAALDGGSAAASSPAPVPRPVTTAMVSAAAASPTSSTVETSELIDAAGTIFGELPKFAEQQVSAPSTEMLATQQRKIHGPVVTQGAGPELKSVPGALRSNGIIPARGDGHSMSYHQVITRAVDELDRNTGEARRAIYDRARNALLAQLRSKKPVLVLAHIIKERRALEEAIGKVEADAARKLRSETQELRLTAPDGGRQIPSATRDRANSPSTDLPEDGWPAVLSSARDRLLSVRSSRRKQAASDLREVIGDRDDLHSIDHDTRQQRGREPASNSKEELVALPVQDTLMAPEVEEEQKHPSGRERSYRGAASSPGPDWSRSLPKLLIVSGVITAATLNDVRVMIERHLPAASRAKEMWMYVSNELRKAALGGDMAEFCSLLKMALSIEGLEWAL